MTWLHFVVFGLALWRVSSMVTSEKGPFKIFTRIREMGGIVHDDKGDIAGIPDTNIGYWLTCIWCLSMALALPYVILIYFFMDAMFWISLPFAVSALAIIVDGIARR